MSRWRLMWRGPWWDVAMTRWARGELGSMCSPYRLTRANMRGLGCAVHCASFCDFRWNVSLHLSMNTQSVCDVLNALFRVIIHAGRFWGIFKSIYHLLQYCLLASAALQYISSLQDSLEPGCHISLPGEGSCAARNESTMWQSG